MGTFHICCSTDENYAAPCTVMLLSLATSNPGYSWHVHVLHSSLPLTIREKILRSVKRNCGNITVEFHEVDGSKLEGVRFRKGTPLTVAAYYRILLSSIIPNGINRILYLDCDLIVLGDITDLYGIDLSGYACAAVRDMGEITDEHRFQLNMAYDMEYFNSGVMMINLEYWRKGAYESVLIGFSRRKRHVFFHDQDALIYAFKRKWFQLSPQWNRLYPAVYPQSFFHSTGNIVLNKFIARRNLLCR